MAEICPQCGNEFANTKALGSHVYYMHETKRPMGGQSWQERPDGEKERFRILLDSCLTDRGLQKPRKIDKVVEALTEIPKGVSPDLDRYREAFSCAIDKEKLLGEAEKLLREINPSNKTDAEEKGD